MILDKLRTLWSYVPEVSAEIKAVLITLAVTIFWNWYTDLRKDSHERRRLASMLLAEALNQAAFIVIIGSAVNFTLKQRTCTTREDLMRMAPAGHPVYLSMISRLPVLGARLSANIVALYDTIDRASMLIARMPSEHTSDESTQVRLPEIAFALQMGAEIATSVIHDLRSIAGRTSSASHEMIVTTIIARLAAIRRGESPNVDANDLSDVKPLKRTAA
jgi:hypothetical protein